MYNKVIFYTIGFGSNRNKKSKNKNTMITSMIIIHDNDYGNKSKSSV